MTFTEDGNVFCMYEPNKIGATTTYKQKSIISEKGDAITDREEFQFHLGVQDTSPDQNQLFDIGALQI